jgi:hypothetical protein
MLSDTCFDVSQDLIDQLAHYKMNAEVYGYSDGLLVECLNLMAPLRAIGFDLDIGGDGTFEGNTELRNTIIETMKVRLKEEFIEKVAELMNSGK